MKTEVMYVSSTKKSICKMFLHIRARKVHVVEQLSEGLLRMFREGRHVIISFSYCQCMWSDFRKGEILGMEAMKRLDLLNEGHIQEMTHHLEKGPEIICSYRESSSKHISVMGKERVAWNTKETRELLKLHVLVKR